MKPVPYSKFRINARHIAELMWGTGGTRAARTNRKGAYYYSCSCHGGYVVDGRALSYEEIGKIRTYIPSDSLFVCRVRNTLDMDSGDYIAAVSYNDFAPYPRSTALNLPEHLVPIGWFRHPVYLFEEDYAWSILEQFTDIRRRCHLNMDSKAAEEQERIRKDTFQYWYGHYPALQNR